MNRRKLIIIPIVGIILLLLAAGCGSRGVNPAATLALADSLAEARHPDSALTLLSTLSGHSLSADERALHALITVKATDKAFRVHTSDSVIRIALGRFGSAGPQLRRAETHYYHGRVLADLADYSGALDAFDLALNTLPAADTTRRALRLRSLILSQTAQLFEDLRLYEDAIPFYLSAGNVSFAIGDTTNAFLDLDQVVFDYIELDNLNSADSLFTTIRPMKRALSPDCQTSFESTRRFLLFRQGKYTEASAGIDSLILATEPQFRNFALMVAVRSFQAIGLRDSADHYARMLIGQKDASNKTTAYATLLRNRLYYAGDSTSLRIFNTFDSLTDIKINEVGKAPGIIGREFLKYRMEQKESARLQTQKTRFIVIVYMLSIFIAAISIVFLLVNARKNKRILTYKRKEAEMYKRQVEIQKINRRLQARNAELESKVITPLDFDANKRELIRKILSNYRLICECHGKITISSTIRESETYGLIKKILQTKSAIPPSSSIWDALKNMLEKEAPGFLETIERIYGKPNIDMLRILMLIRVGFRSIDIADLLSKAPNTISSHKGTLCKEIFGSEISTKDFDSIIRSISAL